MCDHPWSIPSSRCVRPPLESPPSARAVQTPRQQPERKSGRAVEGTGLENRQWATIRGFESHLFRHHAATAPANWRWASAAERSRCAGRACSCTSLRAAAIRQRNPGSRIFWTSGAKQWLWFERAHSTAARPGRERLIGGVTIDEASAFAYGFDFPSLVAEVFTASPADAAGEPATAASDGVETTSPDDPDNRDGYRDAHAAPLLAWRRHTLPNAYIERLIEPSPDEGCAATDLVLPTHTDFRH